MKEKCVMKYMVVGANGQLGQELVHLLNERNAIYVAFDSKSLDITDRDLVFKTLESERPDVLLDAAAYTAVDAAEDEGKDLNWRVNAEGTKNLADAAKTVNAKLIYVSTDYVFDGGKVGPYLETDDTNPQNEYGKAKLAGEKYVIESGAFSYIVRTSWVFGEYGKNFVFTMQALGRKLSELSVVDDQHGRPTWTRSLAEFMVYLVTTSADEGIYNFSNDGDTTWFGFAEEILKDSDVELTPVSSEKFKTKAQRPNNSVLSLEKAKSTGFEIISWQDALRLFEDKTL